ncbi:glycosyltransferase family 4 protein [Maribacter spongiicola]|uniref:glycosyltransferase family 4 protein n=1 Tax=Maribacter spongiicola TaxID=1206753 RepID=UPI003F9C16B3
MNFKILIGIPPKNHVNLAMDEVDGLKNLGNNCETIIYTRNNSSLSVLNKLIGVISNAFELAKHLRQFQPDFLYLNSRFEPVGSTRDFITLIILKCFVRNSFKIGIKSHGSNFDIFKKKSIFYRKLVLPFLIKNVDIWWFLSQDEKLTIEKFNKVMFDKTFVTPNIIDRKRSLLSPLFLEKYNLPTDKFTFLFVGRMVKEKGVFNIIKSIPFFDKRDNCIFVFVGDGNEFNEIKLLAQQVNVEKYIRFLGYLPEAECDQFYANTDALVFPSHDEGFAMALFKSVACGMPIITTQIRAAKDYLKEPDNCLWVDGKSSISIGQALSKLYDNQEMRQTMQKNNKILGQIFSREIIMKEMENKIREVIQ